MTLRVQSRALTDGARSAGGGGGAGGARLTRTANQAAVSQAGLGVPPMEGERDEQRARELTLCRGA